MKKTTWLSALLCLSGTFLAHCGPSTNAGQQDVVATYLKQRGVTVAACGKIVAGQCGTFTMSDADRAALRCLIDAFSTCTPARLTASQPTVEGDSIVSDFVVTGNDASAPGACPLTVFYDTRADHFGPHEITRSNCAGLSGEDTCGGVPVAHDCTEQSRQSY